MMEDIAWGWVRTQPGVGQGDRQGLGQTQLSREQASGGPGHRATAAGEAGGEGQRDREGQ